MKRLSIWSVVLIVLGFLLGLASWGLSSMMKTDAPAIPPERVAEHLHAIIQASRTVYATHVVDKLQARGIVEAAEYWKQEDALPLPAQFLIETGRLAAEEGTGLKIRLVSLWPIYVWNSPSTDFERKGLEAVARDPTQPFTGFVRVGRERYFQAVYADIAISQSCVDCHNTHVNSPRRDFKLNDVMGGIVITVPVQN
ncbi:Tll0287-like domain-containing protein [Candidatus Nitrospira bockiana]